MSDHNPQDVETKRLPFAEAADGAIGLETMLAAALRLVHNGEIELIARCCARCRRGRPRLLGLPGGTLRPGAPADLIVVDPDVPWVLDPGRPEVEVQEHAVRRGAADRPRRPHHRCRPHRVRIRLSERPLAPLRGRGWRQPAASRVRGMSTQSYAADSPHPPRFARRPLQRGEVRPASMTWTRNPPRLRLRLSARLDPVRPAADPARRHGDIRAIGSGNIGATNVLRTGRKGLAAATLLGDMLKGTVGGAARRASSAARRRRSLAGLGAFLGHLFPVWLSFKGGKGVATYIGVLLGLAWPTALGLRRDLARGRRR